MSAYAPLAKGVEFGPATPVWHGDATDMVIRLRFRHGTEYTLERVHELAYHLIGKPTDLERDDGTTVFGVFAKFVWEPSGVVYVDVAVNLDFNPMLKLFPRAGRYRLKDPL